MWSTPSQRRSMNSTLGGSGAGGAAAGLCVAELCAIADPGAPAARYAAAKRAARKSFISMTPPVVDDEFDRAVAFYRDLPRAPKAIVVLMLASGRPGRR